jgi:hypothetical protein
LESLGGLGSLVKDISSLEERSERVNLLDKVGGLLLSFYSSQQRSLDTGMYKLLSQVYIYIIIT